MHATWAKETGEEGTGKKSKSKKEQLLKTLSWKGFRWPLTSNKSSVFLNTEKSLLRSELTPATVTSQQQRPCKYERSPLAVGCKRKNVFNFSDEKHLN